MKNEKNERSIINHYPMRSSKNKGPQYPKSVLRELVTSYYALVDPNRLDSSIDIDGMVDWCDFYGELDSLIYYPVLSAVIAYIYHPLYLYMCLLCI